jgi:hypothetical protein
MASCAIGGSSEVPVQVCPPLSNSKSMKACRVAQDEIRLGLVTFVLPEKLVAPVVDHVEIDAL